MNISHLIALFAIAFVSLIRMYLTGQERRLKKLLFQIVCISFEEF